MSNSISQSSGRAAIWQLVGGGWTTLIRLGASAILARHLTPTEFGVFGLALLVYEFIVYSSAVGMSNGIIAKQNVTEQDLNTCFWTMALVRLAMFVACFFSAPIAAHFFDNPLLKDVLKVMSFTFLASILESVSLTLLSKQLRYDAINKIRGVMVLAESGVAVYLAVALDMGYWALVYSMVICSSITSLAFYVMAGWKPSLQFNADSFKYLYSFGIHNLGFSIVNYLNQNLDYLVVGKLLGARALGLYEFSYRVPHLIQLRVVQPIGQVLFPSLATIQDNDERLINAYIKGVKFLSLIALPSIAGLAVVTEDLVLLLWGEQWVEVIVPMQILCLCAILRVIPQSSGAVLLCKQRPDLPFKISLVSLAVTAISIAVGASVYGVTGVAIAMVISTLVSYSSVYYAFKLTNSDMYLLLKAIKPIIFSSFICVISSLLVTLSLDTHRATSLICATMAGAASFVFVLFRFYGSYTEELLLTIDEITGKKIHQKLKRGLAL